LLAGIWYPFLEMPDLNIFAGTKFRPYRGRLDVLMERVFPREVTAVKFWCVGTEPA
jgi:hypothetical protein